MRNFFRILILSLITLSLTAITADAREKKSKYGEVTFNTEIDCHNCVKKLEANLPFEKGVKDLKIDFDAQTIYLIYTLSKTDEAKLQKAIVDLGTKVVGVKEVEKK